MELVFYNGEKLYKKDLESRELRKMQYDAFRLFTNLDEDRLRKTFRPYAIFNNDRIYGDDFKIEITDKNHQGDLILGINDYDENQKFENNISIGFDKNELAIFIELLKTKLDKM